MTQSAPASTRALFERSRWIALVLGLLAAGACVFAAISPATRHQFFNSYLFAYMFWLGITLGGLVLVMLHNLTGGYWGQLVRRVGESASLLAPLMLLFFIPVLFGLHDLFPWTNATELTHEEILRHREPYLNIPFFIARAAIYFLIWISLAFIVRNLGRKVELTDDDRTRSVLRGFSAGGLIVYLLTITHAGYDWAVSRDTDFFSTAFGFVIGTSETLSALAFAIIILALLIKSTDDPALLFGGISPFQKPSDYPAEAAAPNVLNDVGNILLTLVILWTYVSFMQFLVIWMGNTREDNGYYVQRGLSQPNPWRWVGLAIIVFHFFVPFFLLLFRATKKRVPSLVAVASLLFVMHMVEEYWLIRPDPEFKGPHFAVTWMDFVAPIAIGGLWLAVFFWILPRHLRVGEHVMMEKGGPP